MSKRKWTLILMVLGVASIFFGLALSSTAKPPTPATYKCINGDLYLCRIVSFDPIVECCEFVESGCSLPYSWEWYTDPWGVTWTCPPPGYGDCVRHSCP